MTVAHSAGQSGSATAGRDRLVEIADRTLERDGIDSVSIDVIAAIAGVSRSTAFRQLGSRDQMIVAVALRRSRRFSESCAVEMARHSGTFAKLEAVFVYLARELPQDPVMRELLALSPSSVFGPEGQVLAAATLGPVIDAGRAAGEVRSEITTDEIVHWLVEQLYLAVLHTDRSECAVVRRVRTFVSPALSATVGQDPTGVVRSRLRTIGSALNQANDAFAALREVLPDHTAR